MIHVLPKLPYSFDALEPYIDATTMEIHYTKHHQAYINNLNDALKDYPTLQTKSVEELLQNLAALPANIQTVVRNNAGGHFNHTFFWPLMKKDGAVVQGKLAEEVIKLYGSFEAFQEQFNKAAKAVFGSGWAWLIINKEGKLTITSTPNQDAPILQTCKPIIGLDVWEHAYYLKYQNRRVDYISAWWHVLNWQQAEENYLK